MANITTFFLLQFRPFPPHARLLTRVRPIITDVSRPFFLVQGFSGNHRDPKTRKAMPSGARTTYYCPFSRKTQCVTIRFSISIIRSPCETLCRRIYGPYDCTKPRSNTQTAAICYSYNLISILQIQLWGLFNRALILFLLLALTRYTAYCDKYKFLISADAV